MKLIIQNELNVHGTVMVKMILENVVRGIIRKDAVVDRRIDVVEVDRKKGDVEADQKKDVAVNQRNV